MLQYSRIVFVSTGDTCRGPVAAAIMRTIKGMENAEIVSRGVVSLFPEPVNPKAVAVAKSNGIEIGDYQSNQISSSDFGVNNLVLVMTEVMKKQIYDKYTEAVNVYTIKEFVGEAGDLEVPYGGELTDYGSTFEEMKRLVEKIAQKIEVMEETK